MKNLLPRKILLSVLFCFALIGAKGQYVTIPDINFRNWLNANGYAGCMVGNQMDTTCSAVVNAVTVNCQYSNIHDLTGISYFDSLKTLRCFSNILTFLSPLPSTLQLLNVQHNQLTSLPTLPMSLSMLECDSNQLISLPTIPPSLTYIRCQVNQLSSLPKLPDAMVFLDISYNSAISCLPPVHSFSYFFWWVNTAITCFPNVITMAHSFDAPPISSVPICDLFNTNSCAIYWNISGRIFTDANANCIVDNSEFLNGNSKVNLYENGNLVQQTFTNGLGQYSFNTDTGTYTYAVDTNYLNVSVVCPSSGSRTSLLTTADSMDYNMDFGIQCKPGFDIGVSSIVNSSGGFRPANNPTVSVLAGDFTSAYNLHCASGVSGTVTVIINGPASFFSAGAAALLPIVNGDTLIYTVPDFGAVNFKTDFSFIMQTDTTAQAGDNVCFDVSVTPLVGDNNTANNNYTQCFTVTNSYDPNEKEVYPEGSIDTSQHYLTYTIYFQNTGNDTAQHIYVLDTLDNAIDESSIQLLAYSHEPLVQVMGNVVKFNFPNINLPDSTTDELHSHGYVQYRVRLHDGLMPGTVIHNTSYIYFDFNTPVVTNTTFNQIDIFTSNTAPKDRGVVTEIYPNPIASGGELKIVFNAADVKHASLNIYDMSGRKVFEQSIVSSAQTQSVRLPLLAPGIYQCVMDYENGISRKKLVVAGQVK